MFQIPWLCYIDEIFPTAKLNFIVPLWRIIIANGRAPLQLPQFTSYQPDLKSL